MFVERFVVENTLGEGGMATVYQVRHRDLGTVHALKVLHLTHPSVRHRLIDEGRVQARLKHPNVLAVSDVVDVEGAPGLLMEYVNGPSLEAVLSAGRLPLEVADLVVPGILAGVAAAHRAQVVHRDLKPANILLQIQDGRVVPKVADFGLVKILGEHAAGRTRSGHTMGTPNYMAPEQIRSSRDVDARADIFALGAILYELVTGMRAFESDDENPLSTMALVAEGRYTPVRQHAPDAPERVVLAIAAALSVDPAARPASCEALWSLWAPPGPHPSPTPQRSRGAGRHRGSSASARWSRQPARTTPHRPAAPPGHPAPRPSRRPAGAGSRSSGSSRSRWACVSAGWGSRRWCS